MANPFDPRSGNQSPIDPMLLFALMDLGSIFPLGALTFTIIDGDFFIDGDQDDTLDGPCDLCGNGPCPLFDFLGPLSEPFSTVGVKPVPAIVKRLLDFLLGKPDTKNDSPA